MDRGHRILDVKCFCGKVIKSYDGHVQHYKAKHPRILRRMKKNKTWIQVQYDWRVHPMQVEAKISRNNSSPTAVSNK